MHVSFVQRIGSNSITGRRSLSSECRRQAPAVLLLNNHQLPINNKPATTKGPPVTSMATALLRPAAIHPNMFPAIPHATKSSPPSPSFRQAINTPSAEAAPRTVSTVDSDVHGSSFATAPAMMTNSHDAAANEPTPRALHRSAMARRLETALDGFIFYPPFAIVPTDVYLNGTRQITGANEHEP